MSLLIWSIFFDSKTTTRIDSVKHLGVTTDNSLKWTSRFFYLCKESPRLFISHWEDSAIGGETIGLPICLPMCVPILHYCSPLTYPILLRNDFKILLPGLSIISHVAFILMSGWFSIYVIRTYEHVRNSPTKFLLILCIFCAAIF